MFIGKPKYGVGTISSRSEAETVIEALRNAEFPTDKVALVTQNREPEDENLAVSKEEFVQDKTIEGLKRGTLTAGAIGGVAGTLMGLGAMALPGIGPIAVLGINSALVGMAAGGFYGTAAGTIMGAALGDHISQNEVEQYDDRLAQGDYIILIEGSEEEIQTAANILKNEPIKDWAIY